MLGFGAIANLAGSVISGVNDHFKGKQELKKVKLIADKELIAMEAKAKIAVQQAKVDMMLNTQDNDFKLDMIALQNQKKSWKDEFVLAIFMIPFIAIFIPQYHHFVEDGFKAMEYIPEWWTYLVIGMVVSIMGLRGLLRDFMSNSNMRLKLKHKENQAINDIKHTKVKIKNIDNDLKGQNNKASLFIANEEGFSEKVYKDSLGFDTFGIGFTYITKKESLDILNGRINNLEETLSSKYKWFNSLSNNRKMIIISMCYQLGLNGFSEFKNTIEFIEEGDYIRAGEEMKDSLAYKQTSQRWDRQIKIFQDG